jgi:hypothetical protein
MDCSEASMKTATDSIMKMTDVTKKVAVVKEMEPVGGGGAESGLRSGNGWRMVGASS